MSPLRPALRPSFREALAAALGFASAYLLLNLRYYDFVTTSANAVARASDGETIPRDVVVDVERRPGHKQRRRLEFVHLTKTGGTAVERAAISVGVHWGACHWLGSGSCSSPFTNPDATRDEGIKGPLDGGGIGSAGWSPWHTPPWIYANHARYYEGGDVYDGADLFTIVRNPYARVISEYYCPWVGQSVDDPDKLNEWVIGKLRGWSPEKLAGELESYRVNLTGEGFFIGKKHLLPQHLYVFSGFPGEEPQRIVPEENTLRFENLAQEFKGLMERYGLDDWIKLSHEKTNTARIKTSKREEA